MTTSSKQFVGYEVRVHGGPTHRGITSDQERRLKEHRAQVGPSATMKILTNPMPLRQARQWEKLQERTRGYHQPRRVRGRVWVRPHRRHGRRVRGHYRKI